MIEKNVGSRPATRAFPSKAVQATVLAGILCAATLAPAAFGEPGAGAGSPGQAAADKPASGSPTDNQKAGGAAGAALAPAGGDKAGTTGGEAPKAEATGDAAGAKVPDDGKAAGAPHVMVKHGQELSVGTDTEDLVPTDDVALAKKQVASYPDSAEASFILAVALTRTSRVEEALQEVRRARKLADARGGPVYFDKMIAEYETMLKNFPKENRVRYGLAWAYYMKAYLLAQQSRRLQQATQVPPGAPGKKSIWDLAAAAAGDPGQKPRIEGALEKADPTLKPQIKKYYELALAKLDDFLAQTPDDIWAQVYRAFLKAEYTGNLEEAMATWHKCQASAPDNPAPYFFLGEGYLRQGNLKECFSNVSRAIALRAMGK